MNNKKWLVVFIILTGVFIRFWSVTQNFHFMMDEERDALIFARVFKEGHIPLIGGSIPGGLYVGPIYTWISAILLFLFKFDYSRLGYVAAFVSSVSLIFLYAAVKKLFNEKTAIYSLIIYSFSFLIVQFNKRYWPPTFAPSFLIFILYAISIYREKRFLSLSVISLCLIIGVQSDPSNVAIFLAVLLFFAVKEKINSLVVFGAVVISHAPLFIFELRHNFFLTQAIFKFFKPHAGGVNNHALNIAALLTEISRIFSRIFYVAAPRDIAIQFPPEPPLLAIRNQIPVSLLIIFGTLFTAGIILLFKSKYQGKNFVLIFITIVIVGISIFNYFFPGYTYEWFFTVSLPVMAIIASVLLARLNLNVVAILLAIFSLINILGNINVQNSYSYDKKIKLLQLAKKELNGTPYSLISLGRTYVYSGYRYLTDQLEFPPVKSYMDAYYEWLYRKKSASEHPERVLVVVNYSEFEDEKFYTKYFMFKKHETVSFRDYPIEVMVLDNSSGWLNKINYDYFK